MTDWTTEQLAALGLSPGDEHYAEAHEAAARGWPAHRIAKLLGLDLDEKQRDDLR